MNIAKKTKKVASVTEQSQGSRANTNGNGFENSVEAFVTSFGFYSVPYSKYCLGIGTEYDNVLLKSVPYTSIYGHDSKSEFVLLWKLRDVKTRIECKFQISKGSVDEKLPYLLQNAIEQYPEEEIILLIEGDGYKAGAVKWLRDEIAKRDKEIKAHGKAIYVMNTSDFFIWFSKMNMRAVA